MNSAPAAIDLYDHSSGPGAHGAARFEEHGFQDTVEDTGVVDQLHWIL